MPTHPNQSFRPSFAPEGLITFEGMTEARSWGILICAWVLARSDKYLNEYEKYRESYEKYPPVENRFLGAFDYLFHSGVRA